MGGYANSLCVDRFLASGNLRPKAVEGNGWILEYFQVKATAIGNRFQRQALGIWGSSTLQQNVRILPTSICPTELLGAPKLGLMQWDFSCCLCSASLPLHLEVRLATRTNSLSSAILSAPPWNSSQLVDRGVQFIVGQRVFTAPAEDQEATSLSRRRPARSTPFSETLAANERSENGQREEKTYPCPKGLNISNA